MADTSRRIKVDELNFDDIKTNLKNFLKGQSQFKDYNFEGSGLSILLDTLAYNTHYNALYNNMAINEMFLDSASKRDSVVSIAKMLGYTPASSRCATATINVTIKGVTTPDNLLVLPARFKFTSQVDGTTYTFMTTEEVVTEYTVATSSFVFKNVSIKEGTFQTEKYIVEPTVKIKISNPNCDTSTLKVYVNDSTGTGNAIKYTLADDIISLTGNSAVFFLKEQEDGLYEVYFGDGSVGKKIQNGNVVTLTYLTTSGDLANNATYFNPDLNTGLGTVSVKTVAKAMGGSKPETIDSIKFNAPRAYSMQNRAVTEEDYKSLVYRYYPNAQTINVWGGEEAIPPVYGKVYLSIKPKDDDFLDTPSKDYIINNILKPKTMVTAIPELVDPEYINIQLNCSVYYNPKETNLGAAALRTSVINTINNYNTTDLLKFDGMFRYSKLSRLIDATEKSIQNNITTIILRREIIPAFDTTASYTINLGNPIYYSGVAEESFTTTGFYIPNSIDIYYLKDDGTGNLVMYYKSGADDIIVNTTMGTINYTTGLISIKGLHITSLASDALEVIVKPQSNDVVSVRNQIARIPLGLVTVNVIVDPISSGAARGGNAYVFTSSRS